MSTQPRVSAPSPSADSKPQASSTKSEKRAHATFAPSTLASREICPGWRPSRSDQYKKYADEGTAMHAAAEKGDVDLLDDNQLLEAINTGAFARMLDEQKACVKVCLDYLAPLERHALLIIKEARLSILPDEWIEFGTSDRFIVCGHVGGPKQLHIVDFKFGKNAVSHANGNVQGQSYFVGAMNWLKANRPDLLQDLAVATVHFLAPRVSEEVDKHTFSVDQLDTFRLRLARISRRVRAHDARPLLKNLNATYGGCEFCGHIDECAAVANIVIKQTNAYDAFHNPDAIRMDPIESPSLVTDPVAMSRARAACTIIDKWSSSVKDRATEMWVKDAVDIPGFKLTHSEGNRKVDKPILLLAPLNEALDKAHGADMLADPDDFQAEELLGCSKEISMTALDALVGSKAKKGKKAALVALVTGFLKDNGHVSMSGGGPQLRRDKTVALP